MATSKVLSEIASFLEERAHQGAPIFYNELAKAFGLSPVTEAWFSHPLCDVFATLDDADQAKECLFEPPSWLAKTKAFQARASSRRSMRFGVLPIRYETNSRNCAYGRKSLTAWCHSTNEFLSSRKLTVNHGYD